MQNLTEVLFQLTSAFWLHLMLIQMLKGENIMMETSSHWDGTGLNAIWTLPAY